MQPSTRVVSRRRFLGSVAAAGTAPLLAPALAPAQPAEPLTRVSRGLVLSGGGARGAYEAGILGALAAANGTKDGQPFAPYGFICGTSIGAINGWMVATGQYTRLQNLWDTIAAERILHVKREFAAINNPSSGVGTRIYQGLRLVKGLRTNVRAVIQSQPVLAWLKANVDPQVPLLLPFVWTATNLTTQQTEYFYRTPRTLSSDRLQILLAAFRRTIGPTAILREVPDEYLPHALFASAALPIVFDPVELPSVDGTQINQYVDGGVAANTPISLARTVARNVDVVLVDPPFEPVPYDNAVEIGLGVFGTMQRRLFENEIRSAFLETIGKREFEQLAASRGGMTGMMQSEIAGLQTYFAGAADTELAYIRPARTLPLRVGAFNDDGGIHAAIALGEQDGRAGFRPYTLSDFLSISAIQSG
ncbi:MAG: patatin-like phospholipase family protein [Vulcanimicrobiaceae bacterium]